MSIPFFEHYVVIRAGWDWKNYAKLTCKCTYMVHTEAKHRCAKTCNFEHPTFETSLKTLGLPFFLQKKCVAMHEISGHSITFTKAEQ